MELEPRVDSLEKVFRDLSPTMKTMEDRIAALERTWFRTVAIGSACGIAMAIVFAIGTQSIPNAALNAALKAGEEAGAKTGKLAAETAAESEVAKHMGPKVKADLESNRKRAKEAADSAEEDFRKVATILERLGELPVGTIVPLHLDGNDETVYRHLSRISRKWALCDGKVLNADHPQHFKQEEVDAIFWNRPVPNLEGRFLRGADATNAVATQGGQDIARGLKTSNSGSHVHNLPDVTGAIADKGDDPGKLPYLVRDDDGDSKRPGTWRTRNHLATESSPASEGQHLHFLGGSTGSSGEHSHGIPDVPTVPRYHSVRYAIRIK